MHPPPPPPRDNDARRDGLRLENIQQLRQRQPATCQKLDGNCQPRKLPASSPSEQIPTARIPTATITVRTPTVRLQPTPTAGYEQNDNQPLQNPCQPRKRALQHGVPCDHERDAIPQKELGAEQVLPSLHGNAAKRPRLSTRSEASASERPPGEEGAPRSERTTRKKKDHLSDVLHSWVASLRDTADIAQV